MMRMGAHDYIMKNSLTRLAPAVARELKDASVREGRREADRQIKAALEEKTALLAEIHHRVKNNMAVILSLLHLQEKDIINDADRQKLRETQNRIRSMAMVHEMLYSSDDLSKIEFDGYIRRLANNLSISYGLDKTSIGIKLDLVDEIILNIENAVPCGLLINELVTNSIWHAFPDGREGTITVSLSKGDGEKEVMVSVTDNGVGMPEGVSFDNINSLGIKLIKTLNDQLGGDMEFNAENGTSFVIRFTENPYSQRI
ncbi:MAG TPA: sensor histidine kinase [Nitrospirae bacterium]|nr:sensor histidine kinase [Nitrospirota bacterium]